MDTRKVTFITFSMVALLGLSACGSSSSKTSSTVTLSNSNVESIVSGVDVVVERGKVFDANVTDSSDPIQVATQMDKTKNIYTFTSEPVYPIVVHGGWIDVNNDGKMDSDDIKLDIELKSYSKVVTPITTYLADENKTLRDQKLAMLVEQLNADGVGSLEKIIEDDLLKVPSKAPRDAMVLSNAIFKDMKEKGVDVQLTFDDILSQFYSISDSLNDTMDSVDVEKFVITSLEDANISLQKLSQDEISLYANSIDTNSSQIDLSSFNNILIYKNINQTVLNTLLEMYKENDGFTSSEINNETTCTEYGFETKEILNEYTILYRDNLRTCTEYDYKDISGSSGSVNMMAYFTHNME